MSIYLEKKHLQDNIYKYSWTRVDGDGKYIGPLDRNKVSKMEGYEVKDFIENFMNKHGMKTVADVHKIENALHRPEFRATVMRDELNLAIERFLGL